MSRDDDAEVGQGRRVGDDPVIDNDPRMASVSQDTAWGAYRSGAVLGGQCLYKPCLWHTHSTRCPRTLRVTNNP